jgi:selenide,water dikinase
MQAATAPIVRDLVLVGGGHAHVAVLKAFAMAPLPGLRVTLVTRDVHTPYSGMLPGYIAGHYRFNDIHIDLRRLAGWAGARLLHDEVIGLEPEARRLICADRPSLDYDIVSLDIGATPATHDVPGAKDFAIPVKPISEFAARWEELRQRALHNPLSIAIVGAGAAGVELALSIHHRLAAEALHPPRLILVTASSTILPTHNIRVQTTLMNMLTARKITVMTGTPVSRVNADRIHFSDGNSVPADAVLWVTEAAPAPWLKQTGLALDEFGFVAVSDQLRSLSHENVFAVGDIASQINYKREKSGVFAVRQGMPLAENLRRAVTGKPLKNFRPQKKALALISTGNKYVVASRGALCASGAYLWTIKNWIDRRFMARYSNLLPSIMTGFASIPAVESVLHGPFAEDVMRCGGCGAKLGSTVLERVLYRLEPIARKDVHIGLAARDDAAVVATPEGFLNVQSVDHFRAFIDDPYIFGEIAAAHALSDIYAMGAMPQSALALATLPWASENKLESDLFQMMAGALKILNEADCALVGGHSAEGAEMALGFAVNGLARPEELIYKNGLRLGDKLILTKPLGTGTLFAAHMRFKAKGRWIEEALASMRRLNNSAMVILRRHDIHAATDITGFGLIGHLGEMLRASHMRADILLAEIPFLEGARETITLGITSSLQPENLRLQRLVENLSRAAIHPDFPLLFDPQTSGGLLGAVAQDQALPCLNALRETGHRAAIIGMVTGASTDKAPITLVF